MRTGAGSTRSPVAFGGTATPYFNQSPTIVGMSQRSGHRYTDAHLYKGASSMIPKKDARKLLRTCASAREVHIRQDDGKIIKAVSVANRDLNRAAVVAILKDQEPLWRHGAACKEFMTMWVAERLWYPFEVDDLRKP